MKSRRRDIVHHGVGKGDASRVDNDARYLKNLEAVQFSGVPASRDSTFESNGQTRVKIYGPRKPVPDVVMRGKIIIH